MQNAGNRSVRIGIVGAGANTRARHIPGLQGIDGVDIVAVANRRRESAERVASEFGIGAVYDSWEALVAGPESDAIVIGTWPNLHCPVTLAALAAGKHVMCEARMAMNAEEARAMWAAAQQYPELIVQVVPSPFTLRVDKSIQRLLAEGYLGKILAVDVHAANGAFLDAEAPLQWRQDVELSGLNVMTLGIWYEAIMRWIGTASCVAACGRTFAATRRDPRSGAEKRVEIPEHLVVSADMICGVQATFMLSTVTGHRRANEVLLFGTEGTLRVSNGVLVGGRREDQGLTEIPIPPDEVGRWRVEEEFVAAIRGAEAISHTTFEDGVKYMEFTEAVARSLKSGQAESVGLGG